MVGIMSRINEILPNEITCKDKQKQTPKKLSHLSNEKRK